MSQNKIDLLIKALGKNQTQFAEETGLSTSTISGYLSGRSKPTFDALDKIANTYKNINANWFFTKSGESIFKDSNESEAKQSVQQETDSIDEDISENCDFTEPLLFNDQISDSHEDITESKSLDDNIKDDSVKLSKKRIIILYDDNTYEEFELKKDV